jgi:hypothetical protein
MWKLEMASSVKDAQLLQDVDMFRQVSLDPRIIRRPAAIVFRGPEPREQSLVDIRGKTARDGLRGNMNTEGEFSNHSAVHHGDQVFQLLHLCLSGRPN